MSENIRDPRKRETKKRKSPAPPEKSRTQYFKLLRDSIIAMEKAVDMKKKSFELWERRRRAVDVMHGECVAKPVVKVEPVKLEWEHCPCSLCMKETRKRVT